MAFDPFTAIAELGGKVIDKFFPDAEAASKAKYELFKLQQDGAFKELEQQFQINSAQIEVNKIEAASPDFFRSGWRPAVGWVCVAGLAYQFLIATTLPWMIAVIFSKAVPAMPLLDINTLMGLLTGLLGLGGMRTIEKIKGAA